MKIREIINKETGEKLISFGGEDFEKVNPARHYYDSCFVTKMMLLVPDEVTGRKKPSLKGKEILIQTAKDCKEYIDNFRNIKLPDNLIELLSTTKKSDQQKLLNGLSITTDILMGFLLYAGDNGYLLSEYLSEHSSKGTEDKKFPLAYIVDEDEKIQKFGNTDLTDGQLKQALEHRTVKVAKILEKENEWHCFFITYDSIGGKENWQDGQPHFHYISNLFGIEREKVVEQIKSKKYNLGNLPHIALEDYGVQPSKKAST